MLRAGLFALLALTLLPGLARAQQTQAACAPDGAIMLLQDYATFDMSARGWRSVARAPDCEAAAADLIARYRAFQSGLLSADEARVLRLREGQIRAQLGATDAAVALFVSARDAADTTGLNAYVDATVAFLKHDRTALLAAQAALDAVPRPPDFDAIANEYEQRTGRRPQWPPNADAVAALLKCFDRSYKEAVTDQACRA